MKGINHLKPRQWKEEILSYTHWVRTWAFPLKVLLFTRQVPEYLVPWPRPQERSAEAVKRYHSPSREAPTGVGHTRRLHRAWAYENRDRHLKSTIVVCMSFWMDSTLTTSGSWYQMWGNEEEKNRKGLWGTTVTGAQAGSVRVRLRQRPTYLEQPFSQARLLVNL